MERKILRRCYHTLPSVVTRTSGTPSIIMSPDCCPWTQIRLGAGTRNEYTCYSPEAADDSNHNVFAPLHADQYAVDPNRPQGRSSSLRSGRSTLTPQRSTAPNTERKRGRTAEMTNGSTFTRVPNTDKGVESQ
jgi:hypothetical protein